MTIKLISSSKLTFRRHFGAFYCTNLPAKLIVIAVTVEAAHDSKLHFTFNRGFQEYSPSWFGFRALRADFVCIILHHLLEAFQHCLAVEAAFLHCVVLHALVLSDSICWGP
jgi:hypothetical protein